MHPLGSCSAQAYLHPARVAKWRAGKVAEPIDEFKAGGRNQQREFLRKDAPELQRNDPRISLVRRRNVPDGMVHLVGGIVILGLFDTQRAEGSRGLLHDGKTRAS